MQAETQNIRPPTAAEGAGTPVLKITLEGPAYEHGVEAGLGNCTRVVEPSGLR
jgi:hypothetical protein